MTPIQVSGEVRDQLAGIAGELKEETGKPVTFGEVVEHLLQDHAARGC